ncbi:unnamed protein product [Periconia digitata]|uniref:Uncharacterized protein n=1 Tax=Periconia digitata TaxID=1303443 RepID=A0A9W4U0F9_9PLEO|nr:unnamed protein product [Periconia digitata]
MVSTKPAASAGITSFILRTLLYSLLLSNVFPVVGANPVSTAVKICKSLKCWGKSDFVPAQKIKAHKTKSIVCKNKNAPKDVDGWNISKNKPWPKVEDIVADIKLCGLLKSDTPTAFYSFGGGYSNAVKFQEKYPDKKAVTINDIMPDIWYTAANAAAPGIETPYSPAAQVWSARVSQALATASSGDAYVICKNANIYSTPWGTDDRDFAFRGQHNVWFDYEFATLQRNSAINGIYTVAHDTLAIDDSVEGSWVRDRSPQGEKAKNHENANDATEEKYKKQKKEWEDANPIPGQDCGEASNAQEKRANAKSSGKASTTKAASSASGSSGASAAACTLKPKSSSGSISSTSSSSGKPSSTSSGKSSSSTSRSVSSTKSGSTKTSSASTLATSVRSSSSKASSKSSSGKPSTSSSSSKRSSSKAPTKSASKTSTPASKTSSSKAAAATTKKTCPKGKKKC